MKKTFMSNTSLPKRGKKKCSSHPNQKCKKACIKWKKSPNRTLLKAVWTWLLTKCWKWKACKNCWLTGTTSKPTTSNATKRCFLQSRSWQNSWEVKQRSSLFFQRATKTSKSRTYKDKCPWCANKPNTGADWWSWSQYWLPKDKFQSSNGKNNWNTTMQCIQPPKSNWTIWWYTGTWWNPSCKESLRQNDWFYFWTGMRLFTLSYRLILYSEVKLNMAMLYCLNQR